MRRALYMLALGTAVAAVLAGGCNRNSEAVPVAKEGARVSKGIGPNIGFTAPDFELVDTRGNRVSLSSFRGNVVLLNFWATWCGPCRIEMPTLQALTEDYAARSFRVVAVAGDPEGVRKVAPFMDGLGLTFPGLIDQDGRIQDMYLVNALPMTYVLDRQGVVVYKMVGFFDWNQPKFRKLVEGLLAEA
ncbi:MAG: TlpA family protein disulfide reductase [Nitrospirae bacterium]|nr:TlpA family protein disulfide reductase [Nitrospirota bacterium]